jgi:superfamily I DNA and/or RNA helicase
VQPAGEVERGEQRQEKDAPSYFNPQECTQLVDTLHGMLSEPAFGLGAGDIGVMATYRRQVQKIRKLLRSKGLGAVRVGTVDDYQGQEERIIFISTVLTHKGTVHGSDDHVDPNLAFLTSAQRFNVATSRAKVGERGPPWRVSCTPPHCAGGALSGGDGGTACRF